MRSNSMQEPGASIAHVRICAGAPGDWWSYRDLKLGTTAGVGYRGVRLLRAAR